LDYSPALDLIAYGETHGKVGFLDSLTLKFKGLFDCHTQIVQQVNFFDSQLQMVSMSQEGEIALWDAQKLIVLQMVRNKIYMIANFINSSFFCKESGTMVLATTKIFRWNLKADKTMSVIGE
jgi:hypothetical protein